MGASLAQLGDVKNCHVWNPVGSHVLKWRSEGGKIWKMSWWTIVFYDCILTYFEAKPDALDPERLQGSYVTTSGGCNHTSYNEPAAGAAFFLQHVSRRPKGLMFWLVARITNRSYQFLEDESDDDYTDQWSYYCKPVIITRSMTVHITR